MSEVDDRLKQAWDLFRARFPGVANRMERQCPRRLESLPDQHGPLSQASTLPRCDPGDKDGTG